MHTLYFHTQKTGVPGGLVGGVRVPTKINFVSSSLTERTFVRTLLATKLINGKCESVR